MNRHVDIVTTIGTGRATDGRLARSLGDCSGNGGYPSGIGGGRQRTTTILGRIPDKDGDVNLVPGVSGNTVRAADLDGDGDTDVVVGTPSDGVRVFLRN